jgi:hypothetical protein
MINKISAIAAAALILCSASVASAATHKAVRHHYEAPQGQLMLLENAPARVASHQGNADTNFQDNWDVSY